MYPMVVIFVGPLPPPPLSFPLAVSLIPFCHHTRSRDDSPSNSTQRIPLLHRRATRTLPGLNGITDELDRLLVEKARESHFECQVGITIGIEIGSIKEDHVVGSRGYREE